MAAWAVLPSGLGALVVPMARLFHGGPWPAIVRMGMLAVIVALPIVVVFFWRQAMADHRRLLTGADGDAG